MKTCTKCHETKPLDEFVGDSRREHGKGSHCKACRRSEKRAYRKSRRKPKRSGFQRIAGKPLSGRPLLLDLFCGAGGSAVGYHRAGFDVVGVDHIHNNGYPFFQIQADVVEFLDRYLFEEMPFAAVHASPPCQKFTNLARGTNANSDTYEDMIPVTRAMLQVVNVPWVIENVVNAPLRTDVMLCGSMFGLGVRRHRIFELSGFEAEPPGVCDHTSSTVGVFGDFQSYNQSLEQAQEAMGVDWMSAAEIVEAIPPAYTEWLGGQMLSTFR